MECNTSEPGVAVYSGYSLRNEILQGDDICQLKPIMRRQYYIPTRLYTSAYVVCLCLFLATVPECLRRQGIMFIMFCEMAWSDWPGHLILLLCLCSRIPLSPRNARGDDTSARLA